MIKRNSLILFLLLSIVGFSQVTDFTPQLHINTRSAKEVEKFDWYYKGQFSLLIDSIYDIEAFHNRERDNGNYYYSYGAKISTKYLSIEDFKDTEINKEFVSIKAYFPFKVFKFGYDYNYINKGNNHTAFTSLTWRFIHLECSFLQEIIKAKYNINPEINLLKTLYIGFKLEGIYIDKEYKWQSGITTKLKLN